MTSIKFFTIAPLKHLDLMELNDRYFALAHLLSNKHYAEFIKLKCMQGKFVILDNGAAEGQSLPPDAMALLGAHYQPTEIVSPDVLHNAEQTWKNFIDFKHGLQFRCVDKCPDIMFVPQGQTFNQWMQSYQSGLKDKAIKTIGISKYAAVKTCADATGSTEVSVNRNYLIRQLTVRGLIEKPLHLLGMRDPDEYDFYQMYFYKGKIRSSDSCLTVLNAINYKSVWQSFNSINSPSDFFQADLDEKALTVARKNIEELNWAFDSDTVRK